LQLCDVLPFSAPNVLCCAPDQRNWLDVHTAFSFCSWDLQLIQVQLLFFIGKKTEDEQIKIYRMIGSKTLNALSGDFKY